MKEPQPESCCFLFRRHKDSRDFDGNFAVYDTMDGRIFSTLPEIFESIPLMIQQPKCPGYGAVFRRRASIALIYEDIQSRPQSVGQ